MSLVDAQLPEDLVDVRIGLDVEVHEELHHAVIGADGVHVNHVVDAVHLLLDGRRNSLRKSLSVGARVGGGDENFRRNNIRETVKWASDTSDTTPRITVTMAMTIATIGRLIKNFDIDYLPAALVVDPVVARPYRSAEVAWSAD